MWNHAFYTVLYEAAIRTLPRVCLDESPGVVGVVLQRDDVAQTVNVHWGVSDREPFQSWHKVEDLRDVPKEE